MSPSPESNRPLALTGRVRRQLRLKGNRSAAPHQAPPACRRAIRGLPARRSPAADESLDSVPPWATASRARSRFIEHAAGIEPASPAWKAGASTTRPRVQRGTGPGLGSPPHIRTCARGRPRNRTSLAGFGDQPDPRSLPSGVDGGTWTRFSRVHSAWARLFALVHRAPARNRTEPGRSSGDCTTFVLRAHLVRVAGTAPAASGSRNRRSSNRAPP